MSNEFYVTIVGPNGKFKGDKERGGQEHKLIGLGFEFAVAKNYDLATFQPNGRRQYQPIRVTRRWGESSPQLFQALVNNERLKSVVFEFMAPSQHGGEEVYQSIKLTEASVASYRQLSLHETSAMAGSAPVRGEEPIDRIEEVTFLFQKIEVENKFKVMASDHAT
jgi:type VI secretion system Hcp family effector